MCHRTAATPSQLVLPFTPTVIHSLSVLKKKSKPIKFKLNEKLGSEVNRKSIGSQSEVAPPPQTTRQAFLPFVLRNSAPSLYAVRPVPEHRAKASSESSPNVSKRPSAKAKCKGVNVSKQCLQSCLNIPQDCLKLAPSPSACSAPQPSEDISKSCHISAKTSYKHKQPVTERFNQAPDD